MDETMVAGTIFCILMIQIMAMYDNIRRMEDLKEIMVDQTSSFQKMSSDIKEIMVEQNDSFQKLSVAIGVQLQQQKEFWDKSKTENALQFDKMKNLVVTQQQIEDMNRGNQFNYLRKDIHRAFPWLPSSLYIEFEHPPMLH